MDKAFICSAIGTPLTPDEELHRDGLRAHLEDQRHAKIDGVLVAGTMGAMQLLTTRVYAELLRESTSIWNAGELLVGVGDLSLARTKERLRVANELDVDGVVVLPPFFLSYSQSELISYFESVARFARAPVYVYDLPQRTGVTLAQETIRQLAEHPSIRGIKCSGDITRVRLLRDALAGSNFRVMVAQAPMLDVLLRSGFSEHVDGIYAVVPQLTTGIVEAAARDDWKLAEQRTQMLNNLLTMVIKYGVFPSMTTLLNHKGIPGNHAPAPHRELASEERERLLAEPAVRAALAFK